MKLAVIDTETTSLYPENGEVVEVALVHVDTEENKIQRVFNMLCQPRMPKEDIERSWIVQNGYITIEEIMKARVREVVAYGLKFHLNELPWTSYNTDFDRQFLCRRPWNLPEPSLPCIMKKATWACKIPSIDGEGYKWPKLAQAHDILLDGTRRGSYGAHRAIDDALMAAEVLLAMHQTDFYELVESG